MKYNIVQIHYIFNKSVKKIKVVYKCDQNTYIYNQRILQNMTHKFRENLHLKEIHTHFLLQKIRKMY